MEHERVSKHRAGRGLQPRPKCFDFYPLTQLVMEHERVSKHDFGTLPDGERDE